MGVTLFVDEKAEASVLAALLQDEDLAGEIPSMSESLFEIPENRDLFKALRAIHAEKENCTDLVTVSHMLKKLFGQGEPGLTDLAVRLSGEIPAKYSFRKHLSYIRGAEERRRLLAVLDGAKKSLQGNAETGAVLEKTRQALRDMVICSHEWQSNDDVLIRTYTALDRKSQGDEAAMLSGIPSLDAIMAGFHKGEMTIIGARPGVGKSAFAMQVAITAARAGRRVGFCSREMTDVQYGKRMFQSAAEVESGRLRSGRLELDDWVKLAGALSFYQGLPISYLFRTREIEDLYAETQARADGEGLDMLIVDYAQLMGSRERFEKEYQRIGYVTGKLKNMSTDLNIAVVALAQVGRTSAKGMPTLEELRGSGDMEQDADNVIFLHRAERDDEQSVRPEHRGGTVGRLNRSGMEYIALRVAKQRQGKLGTIAMAFNPERMTFTELQG